MPEFAPVTSAGCPVSTGCQASTGRRLLSGNAGAVGSLEPGTGSFMPGGSLIDRVYNKVRQAGFLVLSRGGVPAFDRWSLRPSPGERGLTDRVGLRGVNVQDVGQVTHADSGAHDDRHFVDHFAGPRRDNRGTQNDAGARFEMKLHEAIILSVHD